MTSKGEYRVGTTFNPSSDDTVAIIKSMAAALIDEIDSLPAHDRDTPRGGEISRLKALAQTAIEEGAMWAVKAATKPDMRKG